VKQDPRKFPVRRDKGKRTCGSHKAQRGGWSEKMLAALEEGGKGKVV
jgi:hypothetical protein